MANTPDAAELDPQDLAEVFDETNVNDEAEFATADETLDVYDFTSALGDARDDVARDASDVDPDTLEDEEVETDEDVDDRLDDDLEDEKDNEDIDEEDLDAEDGVIELGRDEAAVETVADVDQLSGGDDGDQSDEAESDELSEDDLTELGYRDEPPKPGARPEDQPDESVPHQEELLDEGVEETFPASDPVSVKRIT